MANTKSLDLELDSTQYARVLNDGGITGGNITMECWFKSESSPGQNIVASQGDAGTHTSYQIKLLDGGGGYGIAAQSAREGVVDNWVFYPVTTVGVWHHIVLTYDGTNMKLYSALQGGTHTERGSTACSGNGSSGVIDEMGVGRDYTETQRGDGMVDDFRIWNTVRTISQMDANFETELVGNETGLVGYWKLNNDYNDSTANAYNLTASGSPVFSSTVPFGAPDTIKALVVAGGGGGGYTGGGGAGGLLYDDNLAVTAGSYSVTVGAGGAYNTSSSTGQVGANGSNSVFSTMTAIGGGGGAAIYTNGANGGCGGGGGGSDVGDPTGGTGSQGFNGGTNGSHRGNGYPGGGGGGMGAIGGSAPSNSVAGNGGAGLSCAISGSSVTYAGGGGGTLSNATSAMTPGTGGAGGGGNGGYAAGQGTIAQNGTANTGGGGGGNDGEAAGNGGSGVVILSYPTADWGTCTGGTITTNGTYTVHTFTSSGTFNLVAAGGGGTASGDSMRAGFGF